MLLAAGCPKEKEGVLLGGITGEKAACAAVSVPLVAGGGLDCMPPGSEAFANVPVTKADDTLDGAAPKVKLGAADAVAGCP